MNKNYLMILAVLTLTGCQILPDKYIQEASPSLVSLKLYSYGTSSDYIGVPFKDNPQKYHMKRIEDSIVYLNPDSDYAIQSSGAVAGGKCSWTYVIHTPKTPQLVSIYSKHKKGKCYAKVKTQLENINQSGFSLRRLTKEEDFTY